MKKLIQSAFALSLILAPLATRAQTEAMDDFLGLETEILPDLKGPQRFTPAELHENPAWKVQEKDALIDKAPLRGQGYSIIPWKDMDPEAWLNIDLWISDRLIKDKTPDWQMRLRDERNLELVGKVLKCSGGCPVFHGSTRTNSQHLSRLVEGDEIRTEKNSSAWIYLMDGSLMRLSADTSISLQEINLSEKEAFYLVRLNRGHVFWHPRDNAVLKTDSSPETDAVSLPLMVREANQEFFERQLFSSQKDAGHLAEMMDLEMGAVNAQYAKINELRQKNPVTLRTSVMLVSPNATVFSKQVSFDMVHVNGGKSFFKRREMTEGEEISFGLRGYTNTEKTSLENDSWYEVDPTGRNALALTDAPGELQVSELLTRRIKSIELAREMWLEKYSLPVFATMNDSKKLAIDHGYTLWNGDAQKRFDFLAEYTRRIETTNLRSIENLLTKLEASGEKVNRELSSDHYLAALNYYLNGLKMRYTDKKMQIREMNNLQYYVWILKNGKT